MRSRERERDVLFVGRLAEYRYYNMDQVVARALMVFEKIISRTHVAKPDADYANTVIAR